ncbi:cytochrome c oxidase subunit 5b-1, mitochondrial [Lolium perenne]|uniref:cytochrome c oxidase subunit 5b-1, mitochondrial n=1 Tax=Lolium perenne TaxID=4522 RepID=UPI0021EACD34|nr:cytochrome c oxidase subunit 5b-1, mitochondrial-like [Lolium perenne]
MWRRLQTLAPALRRAAAGAGAAPTPITARAAPFSTAAAAFRRTTPLSSGDKPPPTVDEMVAIVAAFRRIKPLSSGHKPRLTVEDIVPIATGHEREELEGFLKGKKRFDMDAPVGPFGTKEAPAVIESYYDKRIVGCPGAGGEDEHDVVWFWLKKDEPHECPVCSQYFTLKVIGDGGNPDGHDTDDEGHHH